MNLEFLSGWNGAIVINGTEYPSHEAIPVDLAVQGSLNIQLRPAKKVVQKATERLVEEPKTDTRTVELSENQQYRVKVKKYMTKPATPDFDFMVKWNNNKPMPLRVMVGEKVKETRGMVYMVLHGDILEERTLCCMKCGRPITNSVSQFFGLGPECGGHNYVNPFASDAELKEAVEAYKKQLQQMTWEGWIIRSAIEEFEEV